MKRKSATWLIVIAVSIANLCVLNEQRQAIADILHISEAETVATMTKEERINNEKEWARYSAGIGWAGSNWFSYSATKECGGVKYPVSLCNSGIGGCQESVAQSKFDWEVLCRE